jgi:hypothetical protein
MGSVERQLEALRPEAAALDPALSRAVDKTRAHVARGVDRFITRLQRAALVRSGEGTGFLEALTRVTTSLHPAGSPQERVHGFWGVSPEIRTVRP